MTLETCLQVSKVKKMISLIKPKQKQTTQEKQLLVTSAHHPAQYFAFEKRKVIKHSNKTVTFKESRQLYTGTYDEWRTFPYLTKVWYVQNGRKPKSKLKNVLTSSREEILYLIITRYKLTKISYRINKTIM